MKINAIIRIVIYSLIILLLLGIFSVCMMASVFSTDYQNWSTSVVNRSEDGDYLACNVDATQVQKLKIEWASGTIRICTGDVSEIAVRESPSSVPLVWNLSGETLTIRYSEVKFGLDLSFSGSKDLEVIVPENWACEEVELDVASADVDVTGITAQCFEFDGASGKCVLTDCTVGELDVDTASGDFRFQGVLERLDCDAASADCVLVLDNVPDEIKLDGASGNLDITLPDDAGFTVHMDGLSSSVQSDFAMTMRNGRYECGDGHCRIEVSALSGEVTIRKGA